MTIVSCPQCHEQVSVPAGVSSQAQVRCPLCQEEYTLASALDRLPPRLVVLSQPAGAPRSSESLLADDMPASLPAPARSDELGSGPIDDNWLEDSPNLAPATPAFQFEQGSAPAKSHGATVVARPRARRKKASPLRAIVQVVGGGVMGLVIAQFILWWMPGNWHRENRDPLGLAVKVSPYAPFLLPPQLRTDSAAATDDVVASDGTFTFGADSADAKPGADTSPEPATPKFGADTEIPDFTGGTPTDEAGKPGDSSSGNDKSRKGKKSKPAEATTPAPSGTDLPPLSPLEVPSPAGTNGITVPDITLSVPSATGNTEIAAASPQLKVSHAPQVTAQQIAQRLTAVGVAEKAWEAGTAAPREEKQRLFTDYYAALAGLGEALAYSNAEPSAGVVDQLKALSRQTENLELIGRFSSIWLQQDSSPRGAVLYGTVLQHQPAGKLSEMRIKLHSRGGEELVIVSPQDATRELPVGTEILVLGATVASPQQTIEGYGGKAEQVVVPGYQMPLPTP